MGGRGSSSTGSQRFKILSGDIDEYIKDPKKFADELIDLLGEDYIPEQNDIGLRGLYEDEVKSGILKDSYQYYSKDGDFRNAMPDRKGIRGRKLDGTSAISLFPNWDEQGFSDIKRTLNRTEFNPLKLASGYGSSRYVAIIRGAINSSEVFEDISEAVFHKPKIVALIRK